MNARIALRFAGCGGQGLIWQRESGQVEPSTYAFPNSRLSDKHHVEFLQSAANHVRVDDERGGVSGDIEIP